MLWVDVKPDIQIEKLSNYFKELKFGDAKYILKCFNKGNRIFIHSACKENVYAHISRSNYELGGLLLGRVFEDSFYYNRSLIIVIRKSIASEAYKNSRVSLEMDADVWNRANQKENSELMVVGWYHSHPDLGAFFSMTDVKTQQAIFYHSYSIGWVIDPVRYENIVYVGKDCVEETMDEISF